MHLSNGFVILLGAMGAAVFIVCYCAAMHLLLFNWSSKLYTNGWGKKNTYQLITIALIAITVAGVYKWRNSERAFQLAQMLSTTEAENLTILGSMHEYEPGRLWYDTSYPLTRSGSQNAWCQNYTTQGCKISTFLLEKPAVVYVDVFEDGTVDAVFKAKVRKGHLPSIAENSSARRPTAEEERQYASLFTKETRAE